MTIHEYIKTKPYLFWSVKNLDNLSHEAIVEGILNYGDMNDVKKIIEILGIKEVAEIFRKQTDKNRFRINYSPEIKNYFELYFNKYVPA